MSTLVHSVPGALDEAVDAVFGSHTDPMPMLEARAADLLAGHGAIVWECDAGTFVFSYVGRSAEAVLGWPVECWTAQPTFWADVVLHADDREQSVTYCAAETAECRDHTFEYRARAVDGRVVRLRDYVRVVPAPDGSPGTLRGVMIVAPGR